MNLVDLSDTTDRRRFIVDLLGREVIEGLGHLQRMIEKTTGQKAPSPGTIRRDLEAIGIVRVNLGNGRWRYRLTDVITGDDVKLGLQDRLAADGLVCEQTADGIMIRTTKGTANSVGGLFKMLMDHQLDGNLVWTLSDGDDTILIGVNPAEARIEYVKLIRAWMGQS